MLEQSELENMAQQLGHILQQQRLKLVTAESCTGGWVAQVITAIAGSSEWFNRGFVTYSNEAKQEMLGVRAETLQKFGAVSEATAKEMAEGALQQSHSQVSLAVTGIAGPGGGSVEKPMGTVCFAWAREGAQTQTSKQRFDGDRREIRAQAVMFALRKLEDFL